MAGENRAPERLVVVPDAFVAEPLAGGLVELGDPGSTIVLDLPGRTAASPLDRRWDSVSDVVQHQLGELRACEASGPFTLFGAGLGGWIAMEMALCARELFERLVLVAPYGVRFGGPTEPAFADILLLDTPEVLGAGWANADRATGLRLPGFPPDLDETALADVFAERAMVAQIGWKPFLHNPQLGRWLHSLDLPVLIIAGEGDELVPLRNTRALAAALPRAELVEIPDAGHYPYLEAPQAFLEAVRPFVSTAEEVLTP